MKGTYKVTNKDGDEKWNYKDGKYTSKVVDYVEEFEILSEALETFLNILNDGENYDPVEKKLSLVFVPKKKGKK
jgi:hypothetical protein